MMPTESTRNVSPVSGLRRFSRRLVILICIAYLALMTGAWLVLQWADRWWPATILMLSPRWIFALPLGLLFPIAGLMRSWSMIVALMTGLVIGWQLLGFNIPWQRLLNHTPTGTPIRVMTLNMHYSKADPKPFEDLIAATTPDIFAVQEWNGYDRAELRSTPGWHVHATPRQFLASRYPIKRVVELGGDSVGEHASLTHYELDAPVGLIHVFSLHAASTRDSISDTIHDTQTGPTELQANSARRREQCAFAVEKAAECQGPLLVVGDFNTPPESTIFADVWRGYTDAFTSAGWGWGYTFFGAKTTVRIDHIMIRKGWNCTSCRVGPFVGSPHRPVTADLIWMGDSLP
jgi:vancomycin resistance protein VanJ